MKTWIGLAFIVNAIPGIVNGFWITGAWPLTPFQHLLADLGQFVVLPAVTALLLFRLPEVRSGFRKLAWPMTPGSIVGSLAIGAVTGASGYLVFRLIARLVEIGIDGSRPSAGLLPLYQFFPTAEMAALYLAGTAAFAEEFTMRYLPLAYLAPAEVSDRKKWIQYLAVSCFLFGLIHWENGTPGIVEASLWGFTLGFMFWAFRNPVTIIVAHFTADLIYFWPRAGG